LLIKNNKKLRKKTISPEGDCAMIFISSLYYIYNFIELIKLSESDFYMLDSEKVFIKNKINPPFYGDF